MMTDERPAPQQSDRRLLVQAAFDARGLGPVGAWIKNHRRGNVSWAHISMALRDLIGMDVSYETLRRWAANDADTH